VLASFNAFVTRAIDIAMRPAANAPPAASLAIISILSAVALLLVAKATSNQRALVDAKRAIQADLMEVRLFNDDLAAIFRALGAMLAHAAAYTRYSLVPALWVFVPFTILLIHLDAFYSHTGLVRGESTLVTAAFEPGEGTPPATLDASSGLRIDTPGLWFAATREMMWRVTPLAEGALDLRLHVGGLTAAKTLEASDRVVRRSGARVSGGLLERLLNPSEPPLPPGDLRTLTVAYPEARLVVLGWQVPWLVAYFVLTLTFALILRRPLGVEM
jgi:hypothetical protein